jgi:hypothetical protein
VDQDEVWDCGLYASSNDNYEPGFQTGPYCAAPEVEEEIFTFNGVDEYPPGFLVPNGAGIAFDANGSRRRIVMLVHFIFNRDLVNGKTGHPGVSILIRNKAIGDDRDTRPAGKILLSIMGYLQPNSIGMISGSISMPRKIHTFAQHVHTHALAIDALVLKISPNGTSEVIFHQDPQLHKSLHADPVEHVIDAGDLINITCTYNNTRSDVIRVE